MTKPAGRDQVGPMERLVRILAMLATAGDRGVTATKLGDVAGFGGDPDDRAGQVSRELKYLRRMGYDIPNIGGAGAAGVYLLRARDNRLELLLTPAERAELASALVGIGSEHPRPPDHIAHVVRAVGRRCLIRFTYKGKPRVVHPVEVTSGPSGWCLVGREHADTVVKQFVVNRMLDVELDDPGTAYPATTVEHVDWDPLTWAVEPPVEVAVETTVDFEREVCRSLGGGSVIERGESAVLLSFTVTNRVAFQARLFALGVRARVTRPPEFAEALLETVHALAGE